VAITSNLPLTELLEQLKPEPRLWVRLAATESDGRWIARLLEVTSGEQPPHWTPRRWEYPEAFFVAAVRSGTQVVRWLTTRKARALSRSVSFDELDDTVSCERRESGWTGGIAYEPLRWPCEQWQLVRSQSGRPQLPFGHLVAASSPSFVSFDAAAASLLGVQLNGWTMSGREFGVRRQDMRARIVRVRVRPAELHVQVEGGSLRGCVAELAGDHAGPSTRLGTNRPRTVRFPLPEGLPDGAWVLLKQGSEWLDRRFLASPYAQQPQADVEFEVEPLARLDALVAGGEGPLTEFKAEMPADGDESKRRVMKTVAAFANGVGGYILFGVSDAGEVVGLTSAASDPQARDRLAGLVSAWIAPLPGFAIDVLPATDRPGRSVVILTVQEGTRPPYAAGTLPTNYVYYARRGATSFPITPDEVGAIVRQRSA